MKNTNQINIPEAREAMDNDSRWKTRTAADPCRG